MMPSGRKCRTKSADGFVYHEERDEHRETLSVLT